MGRAEDEFLQRVLVSFMILLGLSVSLSATSQE